MDWHKALVWTFYTNLFNIDYIRPFIFGIQLLSRNLRGEMIAHLEGAKLTLSDSRFIQVIAKSLSISCKEVQYPDLL